MPRGAPICLLNEAFSAAHRGCEHGRQTPAFQVLSPGVRWKVLLRGVHIEAILRTLSNLSIGNLELMILTLVSYDFVILLNSGKAAVCCRKRRVCPDWCA